MNLSILLMLTTVLLGTLVACTPTTDFIRQGVGKTAQPPGQALLGEWKLGGGNRLKGIPGDITLSIRKTNPTERASARITGFGGINDFASNAIIDPSQQRFIFSTDIASTQNWGPLPRQDFEQAYLDALDGVVAYKLADGGQLTLVTLKGETLQFHKVDD